MISKSKYLRTFKNSFFNVLPVKYSNQQIVWMSSDIKKRRFYNNLVPSTEKYLKQNKFSRRTVLILDSAPTYSDESEFQSGEIIAMFLLPNDMKRN